VAGWAVYFGQLVPPPSTLVLTQPVSAWDDLAMLGPNWRPSLIVGGTRVLLMELACCRLRWDDALRVVRPINVILRLSSEPAARACRQLVHLHGVENWHPTHCCGEACALGWRHDCVDRVLVGGGDCSCERAGCRRWGGNSSCEVETCRARQRLVVRGGGLSEKPSFSRRLVKEASNWSETRRLASDGLDRDPQSSLC
jgi:hypothetical protein